MTENRREKKLRRSRLTLQHRRKLTVNGDNIFLSYTRIIIYVRQFFYRTTLIISKSINVF